MDPQIVAPDGQAFDVMFVGTTQGRVLKIVNIAARSGYEAENEAQLDDEQEEAAIPQAVFAEEIQVFDTDVTIGKMEVIKDGTMTKVMILTKDAVASIPVSRCKVAKSCHVCVALQDPYCAWDDQVGRCATLSEEIEEELDSKRFIQNVVRGKHLSCGIAPSSSSIPRTDPHNGVHFFITHQGYMELLSPSMDNILHQDIDQTLDIETIDDHHTHVVSSIPKFPGSQYSTEELSMAVATSCVCALVIGFIFGFLMARKCACGSNADVDNPYHVPYLNQ